MKIPALRLPALLTLGLIATAAVAQDAPQQLPAITITAGIHNIQAQVAQTPEQRATGLMFRPTMPVNDGMLFAFEDAGVQCFWMKNTLLPLSAAFIADDGTVVNIEDMKPQTEESHCSVKPAPYALEMNLNWFKQKGIKAGTKIGGIEKAGKAQP